MKSKVNECDLTVAGWSRGPPDTTDFTHPLCDSLQDVSLITRVGNDDQALGAVRIYMRIRRQRMEAWTI